MQSADDVICWRVRMHRGTWDEWRYCTMNRDWWLRLFWPAQPVKAKIDVCIIPRHFLEESDHTVPLLSHLPSGRRCAIKWSCELDHGARILDWVWIVLNIFLRLPTVVVHGHQCVHLCLLLWFKHGTPDVSSGLRMVWMGAAERVTIPRDGRIWCIHGRCESACWDRTSYLICEAESTFTIYLPHSTRCEHVGQGVEERQWVCSSAKVTIRHQVDHCYRMCKEDVDNRNVGTKQLQHTFQILEQKSWNKSLSWRDKHEALVLPNTYCYQGIVANVESKCADITSVLFGNFI